MRIHWSRTKTCAKSHTIHIMATNAQSVRNSGEKKRLRQNSTLANFFILAKQIRINPTNYKTWLFACLCGFSWLESSLSHRVIRAASTQSKTGKCVASIWSRRCTSPITRKFFNPDFSINSIDGFVHCTKASYEMISVLLCVQFKHKRHAVQTLPWGFFS